MSGWLGKQTHDQQVGWALNRLVRDLQQALPIVFTAIFGNFKEKNQLKLL